MVFRAVVARNKTRQKWSPKMAGLEIKRDDIAAHFGLREQRSR
jgi:hypothetical protein